MSANKFPHRGPGDNDVDKTVVKNWDDYVSQFNGAMNEKIIGEASADYLYFYNSAIPMIKEINPHAYILIMLRNPIDRAFSAYRHLLKDKRETISFEKALEVEEQREKDNYEFIWFYKNVGFYHDQVTAYMNAFQKKNVKICLYDDFEKKTINIIKDIFRFLEVDENHNPDTEVRYNVSHIARSEPFDEFLKVYDHPVKKLIRPVLLNIIGKKKTENIVTYFKNRNILRMKPRTRKQLAETYREDILKLEELIERDLSEWLR